MNERPHILFTATFTASFIRMDLDILQRHFRVSEAIGSGPLYLLRTLLRIVPADITFSWFASVYSSVVIAVASLLGKRTVLVLGGVDVAKMPEYSYGIWNSRWRAAIVRYGIMHADHVLAVDASIKADAVRLVQYDGANISVLPTGHDPEQWTPGNAQRRQQVLTVAACDTDTRYMVKGLDFLHAVAASMPEQKFVLAGVTGAVKQQHPFPENVSVLGHCSSTELLELYRTSAVYFQPSRREALGSTLCEAMLCGCRPVGTDVGGIPTVIGENGRIVPFGDVPTAAEALTAALNEPEQYSGRERILQFFSLQRRERELLSIVNGEAHA